MKPWQLRALLIVCVVLCSLLISTLFVWHSITAGTQRVVFLLQNHYELRATGGFMGSVVVLTLVNGSPTEWQTFDIYSLAGQTKTTLPAPPGHLEYLSGNGQLGIVDSNWWPDVPTSGQYIHDFLTQTGIENISAIVFLNTQFMQDILKITGPIPLPDYQTELRSDTLFTTIFTARGEFFPGSGAKANVIDYLSTQLRHHLTSLPLSRYLQLTELVADQRNTHNLTIYSPRTHLQGWLHRLGLTGELEQSIPRTSSALWLYPVESNVGINKANAGIERELRITNTSPTTTELYISWSNTNPASASALPVLTKQPGAAGADHLHYINYFRLYTPAHTSVTQIKSSNPERSLGTTTSFTTAQGTPLNEYGVLVPVLAQDSTTLTLYLQHPPLERRSPIIVRRQPGLTNTTVFLNRNGQQQQLPLVGDIAW